MRIWKDKYKMYIIDQHNISSLDNSFKLTINTALGSGNTFTLPLLSGQTYDFWWNPGDGSPDLHVTAYNDANITYNYGSPFNGQVSIGIQSGDKCGGWSFNSGGDKLKVTSIDQWGDVGFDYTLKMFDGCVNNTSLPDDCISYFNSLTDGEKMFSNNSLTSLPSGMILDSLTNGNRMFYNNSLTSLPSGMTLANLTNGYYMFHANSLTSLPSGMILDSLTNGSFMFLASGSSLTSLPSGMTLASLTNGYAMFYNNSSLTSLPSSMILASLTNGNRMFYANSLASLPAGMTLVNLINGERMFYNNSLTSLPSVMTLASLTNGYQMFYNNTIQTTSYSLLINNIDSNNSNTGVSFHGGKSYYDSSAQAAHDNLTITKSWIITDYGLI
jgi:hypothetical protein